MTFSEVMNLELGGRDTPELLKRLDLEIVENSADEICDACIEMDQRINGNWSTTEEDLELQGRFWSLFGPNKTKSPDLLVAASYLRENRALIK